MNKGNWKGKKPLLFLLVPIGIALMVWVVMYLWNAILPEVVGVTPITYWQAFGILILSKILFGGFGRGHSKHKSNRANFKEKIRPLTDEQKESFKEEWKARCKS